VGVTLRTQKSERPVESLTLDEAIAERQRLVKTTMDAQDELSDRNRIGTDGKRISAHDYWAWHRTVSKVVRDNQHRMGLLREHIRKMRQRSSVAEAKVEDVTDRGLLKSAYELLCTLAREDVDFDAHEQALMDVIRERIQGTSPVNGGRK
jgi:hypothetical protein